MQKLAKQDASEVIREAQDTLLQGLIDAEESKPEIEQTIAVLQHALMTKIPISPVARIGGEMGMKLTRAAFAVMIKCTDNVHNFLRLVEDVNFNLNFSTETEDKKKWNQVIS